MQEPQNTLIVIPDISGFSKFVNEVAITHSEHIIRELLEIIIESNNIGLEVSEIEGDAVLFFKQEQLPKPLAILQMIEKMFIDFHEHLLQYKKNRICTCGACRTAHELSLKVIVDQGDAKKMQVKEHSKLVGPALIAAHRLLKNDIPSSEYLLLSERYVDYQECLEMGGRFEWINWIEGYEKYDELGEVNYQYTFLSPLNKKVRATEEKRKELYSSNPMVIEQTIDVDYRYVHMIISDSREKEKWVEGIHEVIKKTSEEIERVGSKHLCVLNNMDMTFEVIDNQEKQGELQFMELVEQMGPFKETIALLYRCFEKGTDQCLLQLEIHYRAQGFKRVMLLPFIYVLKNKMKRSVNHLKGYLERTYDPATITNLAKTKQS